MKNKTVLTEQQLQEELLDEISDFSKAITRKIGQGVGGIKGAGQKIKGAVTRAGQGLKQAYTQGRDSAQQAVAGQDYKAPQPKAQAQAQAQPQAQQQKKPGGISTALKKFGQGVAGANTYNYKTGTKAQQDARANAKKQTATQTPVTPGTQATTATTPAAGGTQAQAKRQKTGGKVAGQTSQTASAQYQRDRRAAQKSGKAGTPTPVPGQKQQPKQPSAVSKGMQQAQKQPTTTAQNVSKKSGVSSAKIGGQKVDLNDPKMKGLRAAIEKAAPGVISSVDKLQPADKAKLKKAIA